MAAVPTCFLIGCKIRSCTKPNHSSGWLTATADLGSFASNSDIDRLTFRRYSAIVTRGGDIMAPQVKRATIYLDSDLHKALRLKAVETSRSVSELVNNAVREALAEDAEDLAAFEERVGEPLISYDEMVKRLKKDGRI